MAPLMILSPGSQVCLQTSCQSGLAPTQIAAGMKPKSKAFVSNSGFLSEDRRIQSQFSCQALRSKGVRNQVSLLRSTRAELAENADVGNVIEVEDAEQMERYIAESGDKLVVVDISTRTCGPCKLIFPKFVKMSKEYPEVLFLKINGDISSGTRALMRKWGVNAVPNFRFFRSGKLVSSHVGAKEDELRAHFLTQFVATLNNVAA